MTVEVRTQGELERALEKATKTTVIACTGDGWFWVGKSAHVVARGSAHVEAWESAHVVAWESAHVVARGSAHVEAWESAHVVAWESAHVEAWGSAHVEAWGSAHVVAWGSAHVVAWGSAHVEAWGSAHVEASRYVAVHRQSPRAKISGGVIIDVPDPATAEEWLDFHGVEVTDGKAILFKAVDDGWVSSRGMSYSPGTTPAAPDWDGGAAECGGGLHFAFHPLAAKDFNPAATRFVGCPVLVSEIVVHQRAMHPQKVKASRVVEPGCFEVDRSGKRVEAVSA